ncbi:MAG: YidH family protein [Actinoallomurus sp.]
MLLLAALIAARPLLVRRRPREPSAQVTTTEPPPDARFLLANERTFLAWNRTALALVAAGLAIVQLLRPFPGVPWGRHLLAVPLILLGAVIATIGYLELRRNQRALYRAEPLPRSVLPKVLAFAVTVIAVISAVVVVISAARGR